MDWEIKYIFGLYFEYINGNIGAMLAIGNNLKSQGENWTWGLLFYGGIGNEWCCSLVYTELNIIMFKDPFA